MSDSSKDVVRMWTLAEWREEVERMLLEADAQLVDWRIGKPTNVGADGGGWWRMIITVRRQLTTRDARHNLPTISDATDAFELDQFVRAHDKARQASRKWSSEVATQTDESGPIPAPGFMFRLECDKAKEEAHKWR